MSAAKVTTTKHSEMAMEAIIKRRRFIVVILYSWNMEKSRELGGGIRYQLTNNLLLALFPLFL